MSLFTNRVVSKHSRAARRGMINDEVDEAKDLLKVPKLESNDVKKSIIRTSIKNENLLNKKLDNAKVKKLAKKKNNAIRHKSERFTKLDGVLGNKIDKSMAKARLVHKIRKAGWDKVNGDIDIKNSTIDNTNDNNDDQDQMQQEEDEYVRQFFENDNNTNEANDIPDDGNMDDNSNDNKGQYNSKDNNNLNKFSFLEEAEA